MKNIKPTIKEFSIEFVHIELILLAMQILQYLKSKSSSYGWQ